MSGRGVTSRSRQGATTDSELPAVNDHAKADADYFRQLDWSAKRPQGPIAPPNRKGYSSKGDTGGVVQP